MKNINVRLNSISMKTHHIKDLLKKELLVLELPRVCDYKLTKEMIFIMDKERSTIHRFKASYTPLGKPDEIKEEDAMELVETTVVFEIDGVEYLMWKNYVDEDDFHETATESLLSAIESVIFWENPFGESKYFHGEYTDNGRIAAELRTFDKNRTLIFVKN